MSDALTGWPTQRLRYLADFNPPVPAGVRRSDAELPFFSMDSIHQFGPPSAPEMRPVSGLLSGYSYVEPTDVAYAKVTPCFENGKGLIGTDLDGPSFATTEVTVLRPRRNTSQRFLAYALRACSFRSPAIASMTGAGGLRRVSEAEMRDLRLPAPDLATQRAIADYLDDETAEIDALVSELEAAQALTRERGAATLEKLIVTEGPTPSELRRHSPARKTGTSVNGAPWPAEAGQPGVLKTGAASQRKYRPDENKAVIDSVEQARLTTPVEADRVLVNRANTPSNVGAAAYVSVGDRHLYLSDKLWSVDFDGVNEYFAFAMQTRLYQDQASQRAVGTSLSMQSLPYDEFLSIRLPVPSRDTQLAICKALREADKNIDDSGTALDHAITLAKERRAALITAAVTGQIDVTATHRPAAEQLEDDIKELS